MADFSFAPVTDLPSATALVRQIEQEFSQMRDTLDNEYAGLLHGQSSLHPDDVAEGNRMSGGANAYDYAAQRLRDIIFALDNRAGQS